MSSLPVLYRLRFASRARSAFPVDVLGSAAQRVRGRPIGRSLEERAQLSPRSAVSLLDRLLQAVPKARWAGAHSRLAPNIGLRQRGKSKPQVTE
jgi:hypothetical protein